MDCGIVWIGCGLGVAACALAPQSPGALWTIRIPEQELQRRIAAAFPQEKRAVFRDQTLLIFSMSHPQISLPSGYDRIQLRIDIGWHFPDIRTDARLPVLRPGFTTGYLVLSGRLRYAPEAGDFYLQNLVIHDGHFPGLPATYDQEARTILEFAAGTYVGNTPVYSLRDKGIKEAFGHWMLRSVTIEDRELVVALGIPIP